tara:strand:- start:478 stop:579 length:102 start_codon:yes stop_codon:yes gene_type:complete
MKTKEKIEQAQKRIKELELLIQLWNQNDKQKKD